MDLNRNQFLFLGIMVLLIGMQVRMVQAYVLTNEATQFLAERTAGSNTVQATAARVGALPNKVIQPPDWLGWCLISVGAVFVLHSLAMPRPSH